MARKNGDMHLRLGEALFKKAQLLTLLRRERSLSAYVRRALERQIETDIRDFPNVKLTARPGSQIYRMEGEDVRSAAFIPLTVTLGGERVYLIHGIGNLPRALDGGYAYLVDLTVPHGEQGFEGRDVVMKAADILGGIH